MKRAAPVTIPTALAALVIAGSSATQSRQVESQELEDGWVQHRSRSFDVEIPRGYSFVDVTAADVEYRRERLYREWPNAKDLLEDEHAAKDLVLLGMDRATVRSHFVDHFVVSKKTPDGWTREQAESKAYLEAFVALLKSNASAAGELFECQLFEWRDGKPAVRKKTTRVVRTPRGRYLKLISLEHWFFSHPDQYYIAFNTIIEREEQVKSLADRTVHSLRPVRRDSRPATKLVPRTAGDISLLLPEGFQMVSLTPGSEPQRERMLEDYPAARPLVERFAESKRLAVAFDPTTLNRAAATTISFARYPLTGVSIAELRSKAYIEEYVKRLREKYEGSGLRTDGAQLFPLGDEGPAYRYDYSSEPATEGGERILRRQLAYFASPHIWLMTFTLAESQAEAVDRYLLGVAASFAPLDPSVAASPAGEDR